MFTTILLWICVIILFLSSVNYGLMGINSDWNQIEKINNTIVKKIIYYLLFVISVLLVILISYRKI
jgi:hypothetical protein